MGRPALLSLFLSFFFAALPCFPTLAMAANSPAPSPNYQIGVVDATNALSQAKQLGIGWTRVPLFWSGLQPSENTWNARYTGQDKRLLALAGAGIVPVGVIQTVPAWASTHPAQAPNGVPKGLNLPWNSPQNVWGQFIYQLARHYAGLINTFIIGNEISIPSGPYHTFDGTPQQMAEMVRIAYLAARAANPEAQIQLPGAPYWYTHGQTTNVLLTDLSRLRGSANHHDFIDGMNLHLYNTLQYNASIYARYHQMLQSHGLANLPIWLSEANAVPKEGSRPGVTLSEQSNFLIEDLSSSLADVTRVEVYQMRDPKSLAGPEGPMGLITWSGNPRPAYAAVKTLAQALLGTRFLRQRVHWYHGYSPSTPAIVTFGGIRKLVQVVWDQGFSPVTVDLKAYAPSAEVYRANGERQTISATHGQFSLKLSSSNDHAKTNPHDAPIGGAPLIVIQRVAYGQAGTPLVAPVNSPDLFSGVAPDFVTERGGETASVNPTQATLTIRSSASRVQLGGWGTLRGKLLGPSGVAISATGLVYVTNSGGQDVVCYNPKGQVEAEWGGYGDGPGQFNGPSGIAVGVHGTVYVADTLNQRIQAFSPKGHFLGQVSTPWPTSLTLVGRGRVDVRDAMNGRKSLVTFPTREPLLPAPANVTALAVNPQGGYAVATHRGQVLMYGPTGSLLRSWTIPPAYGNRLLPNLTAMTWAGNTLYVADGRYNRILAITTSRPPVSIRVTAKGLVDHSTVTVLPTTPALLLGPNSVFAQADGRLVVANTDRQQLLILDARTGQVLFKRSLHAGSYGAAALANGDLVVSGYYGDNLTEFTPKGAVAWRSGTPGSGADQLRHPTSVVPLAQGNIAVWDTGNRRAVIYSPQGEPLAFVQAPATATALSALPSGALLWATSSGLMPTEP